MRKEYIDTIVAGWTFRWPVDEAEGINVNSRFVGEVVQCALYSTWGCMKKMIVYAYLNLQFCLWINNGIWDIYIYFFWVMKWGFLAEFLFFFFFGCLMFRDLSYRFDDRTCSGFCKQSNTQNTSGFWILFKWLIL